MRISDWSSDVCSSDLLNTGGNTDFLNMLNRSRLASKKISKTEAVQSVAARRLDAENIHIGPSEHVAWQNDNQVCFMRREGRLLGGVPMNLELPLRSEERPVGKEGVSTWRSRGFPDHQK